MKKLNTIDNRQQLEVSLRAEDASDAPELLELWDRLDAYRDDANVDSARELQVLQNILEKSNRSDRGTLRLVSKPVFRLAVAASVLIVIFLSWLFLVPVSRTAEYGQIASVDLPDGSEVSLNSGSSISYNRFFMGGRDVQLTGEAYFDVVSNTSSFSVSSYNARVEVLGTSFNVRGWENSVAPGTEVTLVSGTVRLSSLKTGEAVTMNPGDQITVTSDNRLVTEYVSDSSVAAWREGSLLYSDELLGVVLEDVQRRFGVGIKLSVPEIASRRINVSFHAPDDAELIVRTICGAYSLNYRRNASGFEIFEID